MHDGSLLNLYRSGHQEDAFREIVQRHLPLVRGVAGRILGSTAEADALDDVAMRVFAIVARKSATLIDRPSLAGWLVVATRQEARRLVKKTRTRQAALIAYHVETEAKSEGGADTASLQASDQDWQKAQPFIDAALASLSENDRDAVMLRFYEKKTFREVGEVLGRGEDAVRKQVERALGRMGAFLRRRHATVKTAVLVAGLSTGMTAQASDAAEMVTRRALDQMASASGTSFGEWLFSHPGLAQTAAAVVILTSMGGGYLAGSQQHEKVLASHRQAVRAPQLSPAPESAQLKRGAHQSPQAALSLDELAAELARRWRKQTPPDEPTYQQLIDSIAPRECAGLIAILDQRFRDPFYRHQGIVQDLFRCWSVAEPRVAGDAIVQRKKNGLCEISDVRAWLWHVMDAWGKTDGPSALAWLEAQELPAGTARSLAQTLFGGMAKTDPAAAISALAGMSWEDRASYLREIHVPEESLARASFAASVASISDEVIRSEIFCRTLGTDAALSLAEFEAMKFTPSDAGWAASRIMASRLADADKSHLRALDFLWEKAAVEARPVICREHLAELLDDEPSLAAEWMKKHNITQEGLSASIFSLDRK